MMNHAKNKVAWCLRKAEKELTDTKRHRGLMRCKPNMELAQAHIRKAEHNLEVTEYLKKGHHTDWCSSTLFYTMYHCLLAILFKHGFESRNQECTFAAIESLMEDKIIDMPIDLKKICGLGTKEDHDSAQSVVNIREVYQYSTKMSLEDKTFQELLTLAKDILHKTKLILEE